ncbi:MULTISPECIES: acyl-CoA dehydrogenase [unclassified Nocardioides]|jgi:acyl-CoA oxidase|uniref:acyl-CoA dehydrogenase family protein n=1 Tax=unclassified Nocardioides TaxID=2615069 RepID=UPI0007031179|nr:MULTISPECIES: acyl-CoA dehydrogenase [unclassified Nocardioides]KRC54026.1 acyl-CoA oxidase [Nocardioides sp. Root79]KRC71362.1 acyl-CoA oxidase [Nocardioides sp. Root240]
MAEESTTSAPPALSVDVAALTELLDGRYADVRRTVRDLLPSYASVLEDAETMPKEEFRERVREVVLEIASTGAVGMGFPKEYGGGGDIGASIAAFETLAYGDLSVLVKVGVQFGLFGGAILQLGTKRHHDAYLADLIAGRLLGCFAMTETGHGSNVQALGTVATYDPDAGEFVITTTTPSAGKDYIGNAAKHARVAVVFAQLEVAGEGHGVHALVVPLRDESGVTLPGVRIEDDGQKMGLNGVDNGRIWFDGVRVPRESLLNRFADVTEGGEYVSDIESSGRRFFTMLGTLVQGRVSVGAAGVSASKVALTIAVRYALQRRQFDTGADDGAEQLLLDYGLHQRRLLPRLARTYALHFAQEVLASRLHDVFSGITPDDESRQLLESRAAGTKALSTWLATDVVQECREACGGAGYLAVNRFAALKADTDVFTTFEGDNHVLLQLVGKGLLTNFSSDFSDLDQLGMVRFVAGVAVETVLERTRAHRLLQSIRDALPGGGDSWDTDSGLRDPQYHLAMYRFREEHRIGGVARRLKRGIDSGMNPGEVFSRVQDHVIAAARAHVERIVLEAFVEKVAAMEDGDLKLTLNAVCDLHALAGIEADAAWFIEHDRLSTQRSKAITREVGDLCRRIRPVARELVDGFAVPEALLRAPALISGESA